MNNTTKTAEQKSWIIVNKITKQFGHRGLKEISLTIPTGITAVVGPNGAGKTTLLRCLATVYSPDQGSIYWSGKDIHQNSHRYCYYLGYLPQAFMGYSHMTCQAFLKYTAALKLVPNHLINEHITKVSALFNIEKYQHTKLRHLSAGNLQRLGIAQSLINNPRILLLDEPTTGLDPDERQNVLQTLRQIGENRIIVFATHIIKDVDAIADHLLILSQGQVRADTNADSLRQLTYGFVWEGTVPSTNHLPSNAFITKAVSTKFGLKLRVIATTQPFETAKTAVPTLEEAYLAVINNLDQTF